MSMFKENGAFKRGVQTVSFFLFFFFFFFFFLFFDSVKTCRKGVFWFLFTEYRNNPRFSDIRACTNSVEPDQTSQKAASDQGHHPLPVIQLYYIHRRVEKKRLVILANSVDPDQTPRSTASDQGLRCLLIRQQMLHTVFNLIIALCA